MIAMNVFEIIGTIAFAISGALVGINKELDYFGVIVLSIITALGGGVIRDILIGNIPPTVFREPVFTIISIGAAVITFHAHKKLNRYHSVIQFFDALGLGAFTAIGASVAINNNLSSPFIVIVMGLMTGTGGGIIRDVLVRDLPFVFKKEIYATASIIGGICYLLVEFYVAHGIAIYICFLVTFVIRMISIRFKLNLKVAKRGQI